MNSHAFGVSRFALGRIAAALSLALWAAPLLAGPMDEEKLYTLPERSETIHPRLAPLMAGALDEPTQLAKIKALGEIARYKLTDLTDRVSELLGDASPIVRTSALRTLDALDARGKAELIAKFAEPRDAWDGDAIEQAQLADRMLARWKTEGATEMWAKRALDGAAPTALRISAARSLRAVGGGGAALEPIVVDDAATIALRLAAADARSASGGDLTGVLAGTSKHPLLQVRLLAHAEGDAAITALRKLAVAESTAVQAAALNRLVAIDPAIIADFAAAAIRSPDPSVRVVPAGALRHVQTPAAVDLLLGTLDDEHPDVRTAARVSLAELANAAPLNDRIDAGVVRVLDDAIAESKAGAMARWRQAEQAALLAGAIDHKPAAAKLVDLFGHRRLEVRVAAVAGLRPLNVTSTHQPMAALLKRLLDDMDQRAAKMKAVSPMFRGEQVPENEADSKLLSEAAQTLGVWGVTEADPLLRRVIPKEAATYSFARAAGVWALGMLHKDKPDANLARTLILRVYDLNPNNPEANEVRLHSIIAVGRMKATTELKGVRGRLDNDGLDVRSASRWAIMNMTDEKLPQIVLEPAERSDAFISPLR